MKNIKKYLIKNIKISVNENFDDIHYLFCKTLGIDKESVKSVTLHKKSIDARKKSAIHYVCNFIIEAQNISRFKKYDISEYIQKDYVFRKIKSDIRPIVVGFGPAGIFTSLALAKAGLKPIVIERGKDVDTRKNDVNTFFKTNSLNTESNIHFGEGGAGTFSDGKLNTGINDYRIKEVLKVFAQNGAPKNILYDSKPHIGTDILVNVIKSIRKEILSLGGEILFEHKLIDIDTSDHEIKKIKLQSPEGFIELSTKYLVLAIGHSARDTYELLRTKNIHIEPKAFAIGVRIEHKRELIDKAQYGEFYKYLPAADYKLSCHLPSGRSVFTFCMCPGGEVINASSEQNGIVINGMSYNQRNGDNSNSAVLVGINVEDYYKGDVLDGVYFQRKIENKVFELSNGYPIVQRVCDFTQNKITKSIKNVIPSVKPKYEFADINKVFPQFICDSIKEALQIFNNKISGFYSDDAILTAPETRSSSPIRIVRDEKGVCSIKGIYPCGEGAGYAGGITSAAVDGLKCAENIIDDIAQN